MTSLSEDSLEYSWEVALHRMHAQLAVCRARVWRLQRTQMHVRERGGERSVKEESKGGGGAVILIQPRNRIGKGKENATCTQTYISTHINTSIKGGAGIHTR